MIKKREYAVGTRNGVFMCGHDEYMRTPQTFETQEEAEELLTTLPSHPNNPKVIITSPPTKKGKGECECWEEI